MTMYSESSSRTQSEFLAGSGNWTQQKIDTDDIANCVVVDSLYQYLHFTSLLDAFAARLKKSHAIDGLSFEFGELPFNFECDFGLQRKGKYQLDLRVNHRGVSLGSLKVSRCRQFLSTEVRSISLLAEVLGGPLNNAILFATACHSAYHDSLTGLYNRAAFDLFLQNKPDNCNLLQMTLLVLDVDQFKLINDSCGHTVGDEVLKLFSSSLKSIVRDCDTIYRYGGDEFVIALANTNTDGGCEIAEKIRHSIEQRTLQVNSHRITLTTTIGVTELRQHELLDDAFLRADKALLRGKKSGKNQVVSQ